MKIGGHNREVDYERLGQTLAVAAGMIFAIRTAKRPVDAIDPLLSSRDLEAEYDFAIATAKQIVARAASKHPTLFPGKMVPWYIPGDEENPL